jgi:hypothetical protein
MSDKEVSLRDQIEAAYETVAEDKVEEEVEHAVEQKEEVAERIPETSRVPDTTEEEPEEEKPESLDAPNHWSPEDREAFGELDEKGRRLYLKRYKEMEAGYTKKSQSISEDRKLAENFKKVIANHEEYLRKIGVDPLMATDKLLETEKLLRVGTPAQKMDALQRICRDYGINLNQQVDQQYTNQNQQHIDPQTLAVYEKLQSLEQRQQQIEQERLAREYSSLENQIVSFQNAVDDKGEAKHPHFETLRLDMSEMLTKGMAKSLEDAYNKALRLNDDLHQEYINRQYNSRLKEAEVVKKTVASKKAGFNVRSSGSTSSATPIDTLPLRQQIEREYEKQTKRHRI